MRFLSMATSKEAAVAGLANFLRDEIVLPAGEPQNTGGTKASGFIETNSTNNNPHDIIGQNEAEAALVANNERFGYMMAATFDVIWDWDVVNSTIYYGEAYKTIFGYEPGVYSFSLQEDLLTKVIYPEDIKAVKNSLAEALNSSKDHWHAEYRRLKRRSGFAVVVSKALIIRDKKGNPVRLVGAMQDITSKKNLITALNNSVEKIWSLLHNISDIITLVDKYGVIQYQSTSDKGVLGYDEFEVVGRNIYSLIHPEDRSLVDIEAETGPNAALLPEVVECRLLHKKRRICFC